MKRKWRRFEVLLPARYNDGAAVPDDLLGEAVNEIIDQLEIWLVSYRIDVE
jgi:hypothetical protein